MPLPRSSRIPDRVVIACAGDGAMQMNGSAELLTVKKYWKTWSDPRLIILVLNNSDLNQVTWEMRIESGDPKYEASQELPTFNYAQYGESLGLCGIRVEHSEDIGPRVGSRAGLGPAGRFRRGRRSEYHATAAPHQPRASA